MKEYSREIFSAPHDLVTHGQIQFGCFDSFIKNLNFLDAKKPLGFPAPRYFKYLRLKEWQAMQLGNDDYFMLVALYNAKILAVNQFIFYDKKNKQLYKYERQSPYWQTKVARSLQNGLSRFEDKNFKIELLSRLNEQAVQLKINIRKYKNLPDVSARFNVAFIDNKPLVVSIPFGKNKGMYSYKNLGHMEGAVYLNDREIKFGKENSFAIIDDHKGYYPYKMRYDWITGVMPVKNKLVGFNFTDNQSDNPDKFNENALWNNGKLYLLPPVKFTHQLKEWHISDDYGMIDLCFVPEIENKLKFNFGIVSADYNGPFGYFKGHIKYLPGKKIKTDNFFGMGEKKAIRS